MAPGETAAASTSAGEEPKYKAVLSKAQRKQGIRANLIYRVVVCGPMDAGKRTAAMQLREALAFGERVRLSSKKQCGVDYAYVDVRRQDGTMRHTVEFAIIDTPALLDVALQQEHIGKCVVVIACNISAPREAIAGVNQWAKAVDDHVVSLLGAEKAAALAHSRNTVCEEGLQAVESLLPTSLTRSDEAEGVTDFDLRTVETVCKLPCAVAVTKLDLMDTLPVSKVTLTATATVGSDRFLREAVRAASAKLGAAVVMCPTARGVGGAAGTNTDEFQLAVASHLVAMAAEPEAPANTDALAGAFGCDLHMSLFLPAGADTGRSIPKAVAAESIGIEEAFPAPVTADHASMLHPASPASASPLEHHQAELKQLALTVAASPTPAARMQSVSVAPSDRGLSQPPAHAQAAVTKASADGAKADSGDDVDLDFDDLE